MQLPCIYTLNVFALLYVFRFVVFSTFCVLSLATKRSVSAIVRCIAFQPWRMILRYSRGCSPASWRPKSAPSGAQWCEKWDRLPLHHASQHCRWHEGPVKWSDPCRRWPFNLIKVADRHNLRPVAGERTRFALIFYMLCDLTCIELAKICPKAWLYIAPFNLVELWTSKILYKLLMKVTWHKWITRVLKRERDWRFPWERIWRGGATFQQNSRKETVRGAMNLFVSFQSLGMSRAFHEGHAACIGRSFFSVSTEMTPDRANGDTGSWVESVVKFNIASVASLI